VCCDRCLPATDRCLLQQDRCLMLYDRCLPAMGCQLPERHQYVAVFLSFTPVISSLHVAKRPGTSTLNRFYSAMNRTYPTMNRCRNAMVIANQTVVIAGMK
jgi:hypothetical protein